MRIVSQLFMILLTLNACNQNGDSPDDAYLKEINRWKEKRLERLKSENGWLNLAGLFWLEEGVNTIGSDSSNSIIYPDKAPSRLGKYILKNRQVSFIPEPGEEVFLEGKSIEELEIKTDKTGKPTLLETGSLAWFIIERGDQFGIRLRDYEHPSINKLTQIESFPADPAWKIEAEFEAYKEPRELLIPTIIGTVEKNMCPGILRFSVNGVQQEFYPVAAGKKLFVIFADETSALETYGGGRFLYLDKPDKRGLVTIDFNKAFNPPCAFTEYATCPLPPRENFLTVRIGAGEKGVDH
ncbi:MAG: DUF1684 domain-containing protein [Bacteroidales bacterium]|nr:DUF1684 domain-containing protein [Bacteroidales bacterium]